MNAKKEKNNHKKGIPITVTAHLGPFVKCPRIYFVVHKRRTIVWKNWIDYRPQKTQKGEDAS
jgi:hypothetical protein